MADKRQLKTIGSRYDLDVLRHRDPYRLMRFRLSVVFLLGSVLACVPWLLGDHRAFESRCVSNAHKSFEQTCSKCHDQTGTPIWRMINFDNSLTSTSDKKCLACHRKTSNDHLMSVTNAEEIIWKDRHSELKKTLNGELDHLKCAGCHDEHRGLTELGQVPDAHCANCHTKADSLVKSADPDRKRRFDLNFSVFSKHPPISIWRKPEPGNDLYPNNLVTWSNDQKPDHPEDASAIRFSHHRHLDPQLKIAEGKTTSLNCVDCHQAELNGAYFRPVSYQQHCHQCHKLGFTSTEELPHADPEIVQGVILDRLLKKLKNNEDRPAQTDEIGGPTKPPIVSSSIDLDPKLQVIDAAMQDEVRAEFQKLKAQLFEPTGIENVELRDHTKSAVEKSCTKCHFTAQDNKGSVGWRIVPTKIPSQWMTHSHFRHDRHFSVECQICHTQNGALNEQVARQEFYPVLDDQHKSSTSIYASISARDVLMPRIELCQQCHGGGESRGERGSVSDKCVDCHNYHHTSANASFGPEINNSLKDGQAGAADARKMLSIKGGQ